MFSREDSDRNPLSGCCSDKCRIFPDGRIPKNINEIANVFDVKCFAAFCRDIGVEYVNFPLCHEHIYTLCRNPALDKRIPGHSSGRDVIRELLDELHRYGIKLQLYVHVTAGDTMTDAGREATGYNDPTGGCKKRNNFANEVLAELIGRYGSDMDSYYFDTISDDPILNMTDIACLRKTVSDRAPDVILTGNGEANDLVGFSSRARSVSPKNFKGIQPRFSRLSLCPRRRSTDGGQRFRPIIRRRAARRNPFIVFLP